MTRLINFSLPVATLVLILVGWDYAAQNLGENNYLLPRPLQVFHALIDGYITRGTLWQHFWVTTQETLLGFFFGCTAAVILASLVSEFNVVDRMIYPHLIAIQSMPKVAFAPLIIVWFGFGLTSKVVLVSLICFFPMFVNIVTGLRGAPADLLDLYKAFSAGRMRSFIEIKLPNALPNFFAGLQISVVFALLGAIVGEFIASQAGLGSVIQASSVTFDLPRVFACIISLGVLGATLATLVRVVQRRVVFWQQIDGDTSEGSGA